MRRPWSLRALRWWGVVASTLVALTGYLAGSPDKHDAAWIAGVATWSAQPPTLMSVKVTRWSEPASVAGSGDRNR